MIAQLSRKVSFFLIANGIIPETDREVYEYGFEVMLSTFSCFGVLAILAFVSRSITHSVLYILGFVPIRHYAGGYHAKTHFRCFLTILITYILSLLIFYSIPIDEAYNIGWITQADVDSIWNIHQISTIKHRVTFMASEEVVSEQFVERWEAATAPEDPVKDGFAFAGWSSSFDRISSDVIINAIWRPMAVVSLEVGQKLSVESLTPGPTSDWIYSVAPTAGIDVTQSWSDKRCCGAIIGSSADSTFTFTATTPGEYTITLAHVDRIHILLPGFLPYEPIEEIVFTIVVPDPEPLPIVPFDETMELKIRADFFEFIGWSANEVDMQYINTYSNGIAMFIVEPVLFGHDGIFSITIGGHQFYESNPAMLFYVFKTETFLIVHRNKEFELLSLLSNEELIDL